MSDVGTGDPWLLVQHVAFEGPGTIASALTDAGADLTVVRMDRGDPLPPPAAVSDLAGLVVMGGPMSVHDDLAWLADERALGPAPEYGVGEVHLTTDAISDPVFGPAPTPLPCVHWHRDTFALPEGAVRLAGNAAYENQAFRVGDRAYGLQFHVEVTASLVAHWGPHLPPGVFLRESDVAHVSRAGEGIVRRFVGLAGDAPVG